MKRVVLLLSVLMLVGIRVQAQILTDSNLPIVVIETDGGVTIPDEPKVPATMKIIWHRDGGRNRLTDLDNPLFLNYDGRIRIETRGSSSQQLDKKPYGLTTVKENDTIKNNVSLLGMPEENDWILNALAFDQSGMRDFLSYELSERIGQYAPRRMYCEVVVNGDYRGLYVFMEKIKADPHRVNISDGYITKSDKPGNDPVAWEMYEYDNIWLPGDTVRFIHHYPKPEDVTEEQDQAIHQVFLDLEYSAHQHDTSVENGFLSIMDVPSFVDFMMIAEYSSNVDVYRLSTFYHKDRNGKLRAGPVWDYNLAYGYDRYGDRSRIDVWQFDNEDNTGPTYWKDLFETEQFRCYLSRRWHELTQPGQPLNYVTVCDRIDEIDAWIGEGVNRDNQRWHQMEEHAHFVSYMKQWLYYRTNWLNRHFGSFAECEDVPLPSLVISKIHYHPKDVLDIEGDRLEFIEITNHGDETVDLTGIYFRELGITYGFPAGSTVAGHEALRLCSDSLAYVGFYHQVPFGQFTRHLSNTSENLVLADAWGNVIDEVHYRNNAPWPWQANGTGAYLQLIDLNWDNSLPESWTVMTAVSEHGEDSVAIRVYPNPVSTVAHVESEEEAVRYELVGMLGDTKKNEAVEGTSFNMDLQGLSPGVYLLRVYFATGGYSTTPLVVL